MKDYDKQKWFDLYRTALLELNRAAISGRISDARGEIGSRLETLKQHPGLHQHEYQAIQDALSNLRVLEREGKRLASDERNRLLRESIQKLASVAPKFVRPIQQIKAVPYLRMPCPHLKTSKRSGPSGGRIQQN